MVRRRSKTRRSEFPSAKYPAASARRSRALGRNAEAVNAYRAYLYSAQPEPGAVAEVNQGSRRARPSLGQARDHRASGAELQADDFELDSSERRSLGTLPAGDTSCARGATATNRSNRHGSRCRGPRSRGQRRARGDPERSALLVVKVPVSAPADRAAERPRDRFGLVAPRRLRLRRRRCSARRARRSTRRRDSRSTRTGIVGAELRRRHARASFAIS